MTLPLGLLHTHFPITWLSTFGRHSEPPSRGGEPNSLEEIPLRKLMTLSIAVCLVLVGAAVAVADDSAALIELDKKWGEAGSSGDTATVSMILADNLVSVFEGGVRSKEGELADNEPAPAGTKYEATDYKVVFLNADTAIMTHGTKGEDAHYSLHVWSKMGGAWKVVATSTTPAGD